jgi:AAA family ATP:ADP antiporter
MLRVRPGEGSAVAWSFGYFFCLLCSYYILRPVRDEMGILGGVDQLHWTFTGTFLAMLAVLPLFGLASARLPRRRLLPLVYLFFAANLMVFYGLLRLQPESSLLARSFFIWTSVFNLFVVSVFWSFMTDLFPPDKARRLFGLIAAGGSLGAVTGPALTAVLAPMVGTVNLLLPSTLLLLGALLCIARLVRLAGAERLGEASAQLRRDDQALGGGVLEGLRLVLGSSYLLGICLFIWLFTGLATFLYFEQAHIVSQAFDDSAQRTRVFALIDLAVNMLTIGIQFFLTGRIIERIGLPATLAALPVLLALGFAALALSPTLPLLLVVQIARRSGNYALTRPARETLFTVLDRKSRYKAKNFIDTVIYRGGDAVSAWLFAGLQALGLGLGGIAAVAAPIALLWAGLGWLLGRGALERERDESENMS